MFGVGAGGGDARAAVEGLDEDVAHLGDFVGWWCGDGCGWEKVKLGGFWVVVSVDF